DAVEHAVEVGRKVSFDFAVVEVDFRTLDAATGAAAAAEGPRLVGKVDRAGTRRLRGRGRRGEPGDRGARAERGGPQKVAPAKPFGRAKSFGINPLAHCGPLPATVSPRMVLLRGRNDKGNERSGRRA